MYTSPCLWVAEARIKVKLGVLKLENDVINLNVGQVQTPLSLV